jgi:hypothetical protein
MFISPPVIFNGILEPETQGVLLFSGAENAIHIWTCITHGQFFLYPSEGPVGYTGFENKNSIIF